MSEDLFQNVNGSIVSRDVCARKHGGNEQSDSAFAFLRGHLTQRQKRVLDTIESYSYRGLTLEEIADMFRVPPNAISGRITELKIKGKIKKIGTRATRSGCSAAVWIAK